MFCIFGFLISAIEVSWKHSFSNKNTIGFQFNGGVAMTSLLSAIGVWAMGVPGAMLTNKRLF
jgi:hypothetical protein